MPVLPKTDRSLIDWMLLRLPAWGDDPAALGLDGPAVAELDALAAAAETARAAAEAARSAAEAATLRLHTAADSLRGRAAAAVATIKSYSETRNDPNIYAAAMIPPDRPRAPLGAPPAPTRVAAELLSGGAVRLSWRGTRKGGTVFLVLRATAGPGGFAGPFTLIDTTTAKSWTDTSVPAGLAGVAYAVIAERHGGRSDRSARAWLSFGSCPAAPAASPARRAA